MNFKKIFSFKNKHFIVYSLLIVLVIVVAIFAPVFATHNPYESSLVDAFLKPSGEHLFGTDNYGRDVFSRVIYATRYSVSGAIILVAMVFVIGTILGVIAGYFGGKADAIIMRLADAMVAFPDLILAMAISGILGAGFANSIVAISIIGWTKYARLARSLVLKIKNSDYISAAITIGTTPVSILTRYILPNIMPTMVVTATTDIGAKMLSMASMSFLGMGIKPPTPEWGFMLSEGRGFILTSPWLLYFPGLAVFLTIGIFNLWGDSIRDVISVDE